MSILYHLHRHFVGLSHSTTKIGWQYRWFSVDAQTGILRYFLPTNNVDGSSRQIDLDGSTNSVFSDVPSTNNVGTIPRWQVGVSSFLPTPPSRQLPLLALICTYNLTGALGRRCNPSER